jgi:hypothetical protein
VSLVKSLYKKLGRDGPQPALVGAVRQFQFAEVAEAVLDLCSANAWHAIAPPDQASLAPVRPAYARLKAALEPVTDTTLHELLNRFDLARVLLLTAIVTV